MPHPFEPSQVYAGKWPILLQFTVSIVVLGLYVYFAGGFVSDLGGDPDEAAHAVTSLMVRDYVVDGLGQSPMSFAKAYYQDFPRVALGHYPPLFYCLAAPLLLIKISVNSLIWLQIASLATLATLTCILGKKFLPPPLAWAASISLFLLPVALKLTLNVMSDILLALFCLWSALLWAEYLRNPTLQRALIWGCVAAAAILTKGSGIGLCLLPPLGTLLAGRGRLMFHWSWWCSALPVAVFAAPWMIYSSKISKEGMTQLNPWQYLLESLPFHLKALPVVFGWPLTLLALVAIGLSVFPAWKRRRLGPEAASLAAMTVGMTAVLLLVPVGLTTRYMLTLCPSILLASASVFAMLPWCRERTRSLTFCAGLLLFFSLFPLFNSDVLPLKDVHGFGSAVFRAGVPDKNGAHQQWLVASDPRGEGAVIAAAAFACPKRSPSLLRVYRGSKELAKSDWMGRGYEIQQTSPASLLNHLDELKVTRVFLDLSMPENARKEHEKRLLAALETAPKLWQLEHEQIVSREPWLKGRLLVYRRL
jgi:hypothetical protein